MQLIPSPGRHSRRLGVSVVVAASITVTVTSPAGADDWFGWATCSPGSTAPGCEVGAQAPGSPGKPATKAAARSGRGTAAPEPCQDRTGNAVACYEPGAGWLGSDGCYYKAAATPSADLQAVLGGAGQGPGGWYEYVCPGLAGTGGGIKWVAGQPPGAQAVDLAALARQAVSRLGLPELRIAMSPAGAQLVMVPTWLWIDSGSWQPRQATAQVPGLVVTATATPTRVVWRTGDGATVTCTGPGTAWTPGTDPATPSPTCGHTYRRSSAGMPGGAFPVTATVSWDVAWAGGGQGGTVPGLSTVATAAVRVAEVQAVVAG